jgi:hypothetical protein
MVKYGSEELSAGANGFYRLEYVMWDGQYFCRKSSWGGSKMTMDISILIAELNMGKWDGY